MTDEQIKVLEAMRSFCEAVLPSLSEHSKVRNEYQNDYDALTAAIEYIRDMREIEAAEYVIIGEHHLCRFNVGWKDGPHGAAFNHLREAFKSVKEGKD